MADINSKNYPQEITKNSNGINITNKIQYNNDNLKIENSNSFNYDKPLSPLSEKKYRDEYALNALRKLDMVHPINNYYNNIIEPPNTYKVFIRPDGKPDFGNYRHFNNHVDFDPKKYRRPEIYYGFVHDLYIMPQILLGNVRPDKKRENEDEKNDNKDKNDEKNKELDKNGKKDAKKIKTKNVNKKGKENTIKSLDDIMNKFNLKYIEPPPKEKKIVPPPEEVPPEEEEENKDNKDKNKGKKESANKSKNIKDDKTKNSKPTKK